MTTDEAIDWLVERLPVGTHIVLEVGDILRIWADKGSARVGVSAELDGTFPFHHVQNMAAHFVFDLYLWGEL